ncbi:hypothetical protein [Mesorhizobium sp.]|uniref:hypothetical protein n=1 Tax=Mesorhizobium sp. TaxID=1871066 RepID=UPI00257FE9B8|nr:hypothetical protein [Mesorhizobium sp.]
MDVALASPIANIEERALSVNLPISPQVGEMPNFGKEGRTEGAKECNRWKTASVRHVILFHHIAAQRGDHILRRQPKCALVGRPRDLAKALAGNLSAPLAIAKPRSSASSRLVV